MRHDSFEVPLHTLGVPLRTSGLLWQLALHGLLDRCPRNVQLDLELVRCGEVTGRNPSRRQQEAPLVLRGSMAQLSSSLSLIALWFQLLTRLPRELEHSWLEPNPSFLPSFLEAPAVRCPHEKHHLTNLNNTRCPMLTKLKASEVGLRHTSSKQGCKLRPGT